VNPDDPLARDLLTWELALARRDRAAVEDELETLIDEAFSEVGASGRTYDRGSILPLLRGRPAPELAIDGFTATELAGDVVLVTYRTIVNEPGGPPAITLRASIWVRRGGRWRLRYHQGTRGPQPA
jgi:glyoxylase I family protein